MVEGRGLILGMDICKDFIQLAYYDEKLSDAVSVGKEEEAYLIVAEMAFREDTGEWLIGNEVVRALQEGKSPLQVENFLSKMEEGKETFIFDRTYSAGELMAKFIERAFFLLKTFHPYEEIEYLAFAFESLSKTLISVMQEAMKILGLQKKYTLLDHEEAFYYHTLYQNKDRRLNDTAIFELDEENLRFSILHIEEDSDPAVAQISEKYVSADITRKMTETEAEVSERLFENLALMALEKRFVSNIYAVGRGFLSAWADEVLRKLAPGRRVYRGQNLFVRGACFLARNRAEKREENVLFLGGDRILAGISIMAIKDGKEQERMLIHPSLKWYEAQVTEDLIIKGEDEICIQMKDFISKKIVKKFLSLSGINLTGNDISRIRLSIRFKEKNLCVIKAVDLGFGSFVPTTNRVWELKWEK